MLDSTVGKILTSRRVEPSVPSNAENTATKAESSLKQGTPEAEVRLVVKFFVEEHIVFNGKVEEVKQLESEELSRIVSRIAWDGAKTLDKGCTQVRQHNIGLENEDHSGQQNCCTQLNASPNHETPSFVSDLEPRNCDVDLPTDIADSSDHMSEVPESISDLSESPRCEDDQVAQIQEERQEAEFEMNSECDKAFDSRELNDVHIISSPFQTRLKMVDREESLNEQKATNDIDLSERLQGITGTVSDTCIEDQSIVDTLNDCVNSVDLESRQISETIDNSPIQVEKQAEETKMEESVNLYSELKHSEDQKHNEKQIIRFQGDLDHVKKPLREDTNMSQANKTSGNGEEPSASSQENCYNECSAQSDTTYCESDLTPKLVSNSNSSSCHPGRRKNKNDGGPASKRIRRIGAKERRNSKNSSTRNPTGLGSTYQKIDEADLSTAKTNGQFARQSKIFAKWSDNHFYPGTILRPSKDRKYVISFFDGAQRNVADTDLIPLCNIEGKQVRVSIAKNYCVNAIVHDQQSSVNEQPMFDVEYQQDGLVRKCVPLKDIFLTGEQGTPLINQPIRPEKKPDDTMFAGVDLDNIVHVKRSRRLQEMEDSDLIASASSNGDCGSNGTRRKRGQYNMRNMAPQARTSATSVEGLNDRVNKRLTTSTEDNHNALPEDSCSPDNLKSNFNCSNCGPTSESPNSTGSSNAQNVPEIHHEFYFDSSSSHRTKASLLL